VKPLAKIRGRSGDSVRAGTLRRGDLEAIGGLLENIGDGPVLVSGAGEGRLAVSTALASASTAKGARTVLVDCDIEDPTLADALGLADEPGLHEYLRAEAKATEILQPLVLAGPASKQATDPLVCISAGAPADEGRVPIDSSEFKHAVAKLRSGYDLVVLHGPPLGDDSGALRAAALHADVLLACVGPSLASGRAGRRLQRALRAMPGGRAEIVVYG
jgi:MinD-like ATPase involved in chromosome partitioning or flagellar assembly